MLPGKDGFAVATELRKASNYIPLLMLTARGRPEDVLKGFASGADDYLPKPFDLAILLARIRSLLRRRDWGQTLLTDPPAEARVAEPKDAEALREFDVYTFAGKQVDFGTLELRANGKIFRLTLMEAELLRHLIRNSGKVVSRKQILEEVWGLHEDTDTRAIDNFIVRLRKYIEKDPSQSAASADSARRRLPFPARASRQWPDRRCNAGCGSVGELARPRQYQGNVVGLLAAGDPVGDRAGHDLADARQRLIAMRWINSISRSSPNSPNSFSGSVTPSL